MRMRLDLIDVGLIGLIGLIGFKLGLGLGL